MVSGAPISCLQLTTSFGNVMEQLEKETRVDMAEFKKGVAVLTKLYQLPGQSKPK